MRNSLGSATSYYSGIMSSCKYQICAAGIMLNNKSSSFLVNSKKGSLLILFIKRVMYKKKTKVEGDYQ